MSGAYRFKINSGIANYNGLFKRFGPIRLVCAALVLAGAVGVLVTQTSAAPVSASFAVASSADDAEENSSGRVDLDSSDLELVTESTVQKVGIRFTSVSIPAGARVTDAYIQFTSDETSSDSTSLTIAAQALDNAPAFTTATGNVSSRPKTAATVAWSPASWTTTSTAGVDQRTPNLSAAVQEVVDRQGWVSGNALAFTITGQGKRVAAAFDGSRTEPRFHVVYETEPAPNTAPVVNAGADHTVYLPTNSVTLSGSVTDDGKPAPTTSQWTKISGTGTVTFADASKPETSATFSEVGTYTLRLTASDTELTASDEVVITVNPEPVVTPNAAPTVDAGADQTVMLSQGTTGGTPTPGLPGALNGVMPEGHGHIGPYVDSNGNMYTVIEDFLDNGNEPMAMKSTNGGATWSEIDAANRTSTGDLEGSWAIQVGTRIYFAWQKSSGGIYMAAFNTSDATSNPDKWAVVRETIHAPSSKPNDQWVSISPLSNGDIWAFYSTEKTSSQSHRVGFKKRSASGAYSSQMILDSGRTVSQVVAVQGANDVTHVFYKDHVNRQVYYRSLSASGALSSPVRVDSTGAHKIHSPMTNAVVHQMNGVEHVTVAWADASGYLKSSTIVGGVPGAQQNVSGVPVTINPGSTTNLGAIAHLSADGADVHALYADAATQDIWHDKRASGNWGTDAEIQDNLQTQWLTGLHTFTNRGGQRVLGYIYDTGPHGDDGGIIRYNEYVIGNQAAASSATASLNGTASDDGQPNPPSTLNHQWSVISGPGTVSFDDPSALTAKATMTASGQYVLRLTSSDSALTSWDEVTITVQ